MFRAAEYPDKTCSYLYIRINLKKLPPETLMGSGGSFFRMATSERNILFCRKAVNSPLPINPLKARGNLIPLEKGTFQFLQCSVQSPLPLYITHQSKCQVNPRHINHHIRQSAAPFKKELQEFREQSKQAAENKGFFAVANASVDQ